MSDYMAVADAYKGRPDPTRECVESVVSVVSPGAGPREAGAVSAVSPLPAVHDADDPWAKPTAPCMVCGHVRWRVWCHDERKGWQWICNRCRPLVVRNHDGTIWRSDGAEEEAHG